MIRGAAEAETGDIPAGTKSVDAALELMKPQPGETVQDLGLIGIIDQALGCRKAFKEGKPFRTGTP